VRPKRVVNIDTDTFECLHHWVGGNVIDVSFLARAKTFPAFDGDPVKVTIQAADGGSVHGADMRIDDITWVSGRIVRMRLTAASTDAITRVPYQPSNPTFI
jgi:hypothetical protein